VLITSVIGTNTGSPFTDGSFINDCLLQPMLHVNHPQLTDVIDPLLSTAALFLYSWGSDLSC